MSEKLHELVKEINDLLEAKEGRLKVRPPNPRVILPSCFLPPKDP
jgi:hypothetical protein